MIRALVVPGMLPHPNLTHPDQGPGRAGVHFPEEVIEDEARVEVRPALPSVWVRACVRVGSGVEILAVHRV